MSGPPTPPPPPPVSIPAAPGAPPPPPGGVPKASSKPTAGLSMLEQMALKAKEREGATACPVTDAERSMADRQFARLLTRDPNASFLVKRGYNPIDVVIMTPEQRAALRKSLPAKPTCHTPDELVEMLKKRTFGWLFADDCYPVDSVAADDPDKGLFTTETGCREHKLFEGYRTTFFKLTDELYGSGLDSEKSRVNQWFMDLPRDKQKAAFEQLTASLDTAVQEVDKQVLQKTPAQMKAIEDLSKQLSNPALTKMAKANLQNKLEEAKNAGTVVVTRVKEPNKGARKGLIKAFVQKEVLGEDVPVGSGTPITITRAELPNWLEKMKQCNAKGLFMAADGSCFAASPTSPSGSAPSAPSAPTSTFTPPDWLDKMKSCNAQGLFMAEDGTCFVRQRTSMPRGVIARLIKQEMARRRRS